IIGSKRGEDEIYDIALKLAKLRHKYEDFKVSNNWIFKMLRNPERIKEALKAMIKEEARLPGVEQVLSKEQKLYLSLRLWLRNFAFITVKELAKVFVDEISWSNLVNFMLERIKDDRELLGQFAKVIKNKPIESWQDNENIAVGILLLSLDKGVREETQRILVEVSYGLVMRWYGTKEDEYDAAVDLIYQATRNFNPYHFIKGECRVASYYTYVHSLLQERLVKIRGYLSGLSEEDRQAARDVFQLKRRLIRDGTYEGEEQIIEQLKDKYPLVIIKRVLGLNKVISLDQRREDGFGMYDRIAKGDDAGMGLDTFPHTHHLSDVPLPGFGPISHSASKLWSYMLNEEMYEQAIENSALPMTNRLNLWWSPYQAFLARPTPHGRQYKSNLPQPPKEMSKKDAYWFRLSRYYELFSKVDKSRKEKFRGFADRKPRIGSKDEIVLRMGRGRAVTIFSSCKLVSLMGITTVPAILGIAYHYRAGIYRIGAKLLQWFVSKGVIRGLPEKLPSISIFSPISHFYEALPNSLNFADTTLSTSNILSKVEALRISDALPLILPIIVVAVMLILLLVPEVIRWLGQRRSMSAEKKKDKYPNINGLGLEKLKHYLNRHDQLKDLDEQKINDLTQWIVKHKPWRSRDELRKALQGSGISGVKRHHQEAIVDSFKIGMTRRKFFTVLGTGAAVAAVYAVAKMLTDGVASIVSQRDWTEVRNKIKTEKYNLNQKLTQQFLATYPDERDFIEQINNNRDVVFANYVAEVYRYMMNSREKKWRSQLVVDKFRSAPQRIVGMRCTPETLLHVKRIVRNNRIVGLVEKIMQCSNIKQPDKGLNDFDKMAIDCLALRSATEELDIIHLGRKQGGLWRRLAYYWKPKSPVSTSEYAYVDLATGTNFEDYLQDILEYSLKRPILLTDISPYVIRFWHTLSRVLSLDNIQILDLDIRTMSRKTIPRKVGTIRLQNVAPWVQDLSEEWVEQIFDLVEPGGQVILVQPLESLWQEGWSFPQPMGLIELNRLVMLKDKDNTRLMVNLLQVAEKQEGKWNIFAGHVGEDGRFNQNQSGYITMPSQSAMSKIYDTVIVFQKIPQPSSNLLKIILGGGGVAVITALITLLEMHHRRTKMVKKQSGEKVTSSNKPRTKRSFVDILLMAITTVPAILGIAYHYRAEISEIGAKLLQWFISIGVIRGLPGKFGVFSFLPQINITSKILPGSFNLADTSSSIWLRPEVLVPLIIITGVALLISIYLFTRRLRKPRVVSIEEKSMLAFALAAVKLLLGIGLVILFAYLASTVGGPLLHNIGQFLGIEETGINLALVAGFTGLKRGSWLGKQDTDVGIIYGVKRFIKKKWTLDLIRYVNRAFYLLHVGEPLGFRTEEVVTDANANATALELYRHLKRMKSEGKLPEKEKIVFQELGIGRGTFMFNFILAFMALDKSKEFIKPFEYQAYDISPSILNQAKESLSVLPQRYEKYRPVREFEDKITFKQIDLKKSLPESETAPVWIRFNELYADFGEIYFLERKEGKWFLVEFTPVFSPDVRVDFRDLKSIKRLRKIKNLSEVLKSIEYKERLVPLPRALRKYLKDYLSHIEERVKDGSRFPVNIGAFKNLVRIVDLLSVQLDGALQFFDYGFYERYPQRGDLFASFKKEVNGHLTSAVNFDFLEFMMRKYQPGFDFQISKQRDYQRKMLGNNLPSPRLDIDYNNLYQVKIFRKHIPKGAVSQTRERDGDIIDKLRLMGTRHAFETIVRHAARGLAFGEDDFRYFPGIYMKYLSPEQRDLIIDVPGAEGGNFRGSAMLTESERRNLLAVVEYASIAQNPAYAQEAKDVALTQNPMNGGIGISVWRERYLRQIWPEIEREGPFTFGSKASDLFFDVTLKGKDAGGAIVDKTAKVSIDEVILLRTIKNATMYGSTLFQELVSDKTAISITALLNSTCVYDRVDDTKQDKRTYREYIAQEIGIDLKYQAAVPTIDAATGRLTQEMTFPAGTGHWGMMVLWDAATNEVPDDGMTHIRVIFNADGVNNTPDHPAIVNWMSKEDIPVAVVTRTRTALDVKTGLMGIEILPDGKLRVKVMETVTAKRNGQIDEFGNMGLPGGLGEEGKQYANTNLTLVNISLLQPFLQAVKDALGEEKFIEVITPDILIHERTKGDKSFIQLEGGLTSALLNLDAFITTTDDPVVVALKERFGINKLVYTVNVDPEDSTKLSTPVKYSLDFWRQAYSDEYFLDTTNWVLVNNNPGHVPKVDLKDSYYSDLKNCIDSLGNASIVAADELTINGIVHLKDAVLMGKVIIDNDSGHAVDLNSDEFKSALGALPNNHLVSTMKDGRLILCDVHITVAADGSIILEKLTPCGIQRSLTVIKHLTEKKAQGYTLSQKEKAIISTLSQAINIISETEEEEKYILYHDGSKGYFYVPWNINVGAVPTVTFDDVSTASPDDPMFALNVYFRYLSDEAKAEMMDRIRHLQKLIERLKTDNPDMQSIQIFGSYLSGFKNEIPYDLDVGAISSKGTIIIRPSDIAALFDGYERTPVFIEGLMKSEPYFLEIMDSISCARPFVLRALRSIIVDGKCYFSIDNPPPLEYLVEDLNQLLAEIDEELEMVNRQLHRDDSLDMYRNCKAIQGTPAETDDVTHTIEVFEGREKERVDRQMRVIRLVCEAQLVIKLLCDLHSLYSKDVLPPVSANPYIGERALETLSTYITQGAPYMSFTMDATHNVTDFTEAQNAYDEVCEAVRNLEERLNTFKQLIETKRDHNAIPRRIEFPDGTGMEVSVSSLINFISKGEWTDPATREVVENILKAMEPSILATYPCTAGDDFFNNYEDGAHASDDYIVAGRIVILRIGIANPDTALAEGLARSFLEIKMREDSSYIDALNAAAGFADEKILRSNLANLARNLYEAYKTGSTFASPFEDIAEVKRFFCDLAGFIGGSNITCDSDLPESFEDDIIKPDIEGGQDWRLRISGLKKKICDMVIAKASIIQIVGMILHYRGLRKGDLMILAKETRNTVVAKYAEIALAVEKIIGERKPILSDFLPMIERKELAAAIALVCTDWKRAEAARILGISCSTLDEWIKKFSLQRPDVGMKRIQLTESQRKKFRKELNINRIEKEAYEEAVKLFGKTVKRVSYFLGEGEGLMAARTKLRKYGLIPQKMRGEDIEQRRGKVFNVIVKMYNKAKEKPVVVPVSKVAQEMRKSKRYSELSETTFRNDIQALRNAGRFSAYPGLEVGRHIKKTKAEEKTETEKQVVSPPLIPRLLDMSVEEMTAVINSAIEDYRILGTNQKKEIYEMIRRLGIYDRPLAEKLKKKLDDTGDIKPGTNPAGDANPSEKPDKAPTTSVDYEKKAKEILISELKKILLNVLPKKVIDRIPKEVLIKLVFVTLQNISKTQRKNAVTSLLGNYGVGKKQAPKILGALRKTISTGRITPFLVAAGMPEGYEMIWPSQQEDFWIGEKERDPIKMGIKDAILNVLKTYNIYPDQEKTIVDIGARRGWLEKLLGEDWAHAIILFDKNEYYLRQARKRGLGKAYVSGDIYELSNRIKDIKVIISIDTFDTFLDLEKPVAQCYAALAPGGIMVIAQFSPPQIEPLVKELQEKGKVYSPDCVEFFDSEEKRRQVEKAYKEYTSLPEDSSEKQQKIAFYKFLELREKLSFDKYAYFHEKLVNAIRACKFQILQEGEVKGYYKGTREERHNVVGEDTNVIYSRRSYGLGKYNPSLTPGIVEEEVYMNVVVARKPESAPSVTRTEPSRGGFGYIRVILGTMIILLSVIVIYLFPEIGVQALKLQRYFSAPGNGAGLASLC
ncbi:MAG: methyltransferase domain-containing protein, partial [bacterium]